MTDPKIFYRELDDLLAAIRIDRSQNGLIPRVTSFLESTFAEQLHIANGRMYEQRGDEFLLVHPKKHPAHWIKSLSDQSQVIKLAEKHRSYIYDDPQLSATFYRSGAAWPHVTAIWVHDQEKKWVIIFELTNAWVREEVSLFLNAVRTSLNYRLFTDIIGGHLEQAVEIQKSLLPKSSLQVEGYDIYGNSQPAELVGGDFYDYHDYQDGTFSVSIGDASGHGIPAALLVRDVVIGLRMGLAKDMRILHTLQKLNTVIQRSTYSTNFVSLFVGEIEEDGHLFYANAGHPGPILITDEDDEELPATGITLGFLPEIKMARSHASLPPGGVLVMFTDGIIERETENEEQYGTDRLKKLVRKHRSKSAKELSGIVFKDVFDFGQRTAWEDDATVVVVKRIK
jgi:phosphoserine phosphatase RsbU/P